MIETQISNVQTLLPLILFWQRRWEVSYMDQIPTVRAVHILSADISNPKGSVAKQVTVCFKSLPDASFSQTQMKNRRGPLDFPGKPILVGWWNKPSRSVQWRWKLIYWYKQQHEYEVNMLNQWQQTYEFHFFYWLLWIASMNSGKLILHRYRLLILYTSVQNTPLKKCKQLSTQHSHTC